MDLTAIVVLNTYSILLLAVLFAYSRNYGGGKSTQHRLYRTLVLISMTLLLLDALARLDGLGNPAFPVLNRASNLLLFIANPLLPSIWLEYVYYQSSSDQVIPRRVRLLLLILNSVNIAMVIATQYTGWYYTIDAANIYHRGPFYPQSLLIALFLLIWTYAVTIRNRRNVDKRVLFSLLFYPVPSLIGMLLQVVIYGYPFALIGAMPSLLIVLLYAQDDSIYTDYLTGVGNRKKLEMVLKEKVLKSSRDRTFSFVMLDINSFKRINDTLGHEAGDRMLKATADLLKKCVRAGDYVTRYGGDEFCLILDINSEAGLQRVIDRIDSALYALNQSKTLPHRLSFSTGQAVYDFNERLLAEAFLKRVDLLMYADKRKQSTNGPDTQPL